MDFLGEGHPENVYEEATVRRVCEMLSDPQYRMIDIENETGVSRSIIYSIHTGISWSQISKDYNIIPPPAPTTYSDEEIESAAKLLGETQLSKAEITRRTGVPLRTINKILHRYPAYKDISDKYKCAENRGVDAPDRPDGRAHKKMSEKTQFIYDSISNGVSKEEIAKVLVNKYNATSYHLALRSVSKVKSRYITHKDDGMYRKNS